MKMLLHAGLWPNLGFGIFLQFFLSNFSPLFDEIMDWKYCSNQFTLCIPPILIVNHFAVDTIFKSFIYLLCTKLLPILYGWSLYKMHKGVIFENLLKDLLINFVNKLKIWISRKMLFSFSSICVLMKYWRIEESGVACWNAKFMLLFWHFLLSKEPNLTNTCTFAGEKTQVHLFGNV